MRFEEEFTVDEDGTLEVEVVREGNNLTSEQSQTISVSAGDSVQLTVTQS